MRARASLIAALLCKSRCNASCRRNLSVRTACNSTISPASMAVESPSVHSGTSPGQALSDAGRWARRGSGLLLELSQLLAWAGDEKKRKKGFMFQHDSLAS